MSDDVRCQRCLDLERRFPPRQYSLKRNSSIGFTFVREGCESIRRCNQCSTVLCEFCHPHEQCPECKTGQMLSL